MATETASTTYLVLDSTEVTGDWFLKGTAFREAPRISALQIALPAPVFAEIVGNHSRAVAEVESATRKVADDRKRLGLAAMEYQAASAPYTERLTIALVRLGIRILPWPEMPHAEITARAIGRTPPFDLKGGGYRDTLVWLSAKALAKDGSAVYLASRDRAFRGNPSDGEDLAAALLEEIATLPGSVELVTDLRKSVFDRVAVEPTVDFDSSLMEERKQQFITEHLMPWGFEDTYLDPDELGLPPESEISGDLEFIKYGDLETVLVRGLNEALHGSW